MAHTDDRFIKILSESHFAGNNEIWVDTKTGVNYLFHASGNAGGLTVVLDENGKPVVMSKYDMETLIYNNR